jgi:hypothetical protein
MLTEDLDSMAKKRLEVGLTLTGVCVFRRNAITDSEGSR